MHTSRHTVDQIQRSTTSILSAKKACQVRIISIPNFVENIDRLIKKQRFSVFNKSKTGSTVKIVAGWHLQGLFELLANSKA